MITEYLDEYEVKARMVPGFIFLLPVLVDVGYCVPNFVKWPVCAAGGVCGFALMYCAGYVIQARGRAIQPALWNSWGGAPSTRLLREADSFFSPEWKASIRTAVKRAFSLELLSPEEERRDRLKADRATAEAFKRVREHLRQRVPGGLWHKRNVEYGFCRNFYSCRVFFVGLATATTVFAGMYGLYARNGIFNLASVIGLLLAGGGLIFGWVMLPGLLKHMADEYAALAWTAFVQSSDNSRKP